MILINSICLCIAAFFWVLTIRRLGKRLDWLEDKVGHLLIENSKNAFNIETYYKPTLTFLQNHADDFRAIAAAKQEKAKPAPRKRGRHAGWKKA